MFTIQLIQLIAETWKTTLLGSKYKKHMEGKTGILTDVLSTESWPQKQRIPSGYQSEIHFLQVAVYKVYSFNTNFVKFQKITANRNFTGFIIFSL